MGRHICNQYTSSPNDRMLLGHLQSQLPVRTARESTYTQPSPYKQRFRARRITVAARAGDGRAQSPQATQGELISKQATSLTEKYFQRLQPYEQSSGQAGGAGGATTWEALLGADARWQQLRTSQDVGPAPNFVHTSSAPISPSQPAQQQYDVAVCGGTLGIFAATALAQQGFRVAVIEGGPLRGRDQEWNISRKECLELVELGLLTKAELDSVIAMVFNPVRVGFAGAGEVWTRDVLNCGVSPVKLIDLMRTKFEAAGGAVLDRTRLQGMTVHPDGVRLELASGGSSNTGVSGVSGVSARLVLDCMGHASPVVRQARWGTKPDGVCIVVGTLGSGFTNNSTADVIFTTTDLQPTDARVARCQLFWEAFPAGTGPTDRTTYMFTYLDAEPWRPSILDIFEAYWPLMEQYQGVSMSDITLRRALFGVFPTYRNSPLRPAFDRVLQIGDASGIQSPLSFGGFGALTRHLGRLSRGVADALRADALDRQALGLIHMYNPGLSSAWMLQRAMSVRQRMPAQNLINKMLGGNFKAMERLGDPVMRPFLQDVIQFRPLLLTMGQQMLQDPLTVPQLLAHVGPGPLLDWLVHVTAMGAFTAAHTLASPLRSALHATSDCTDKLSGQHNQPQGSSTTSQGGPLASWVAGLNPRQRYRLARVLEGLEYGAGLDYKL